MFGSLFRQAQATVDNAIGQIVNRIIVAVPFVVALGFATAALSSWLSRTYGGEMANLILAAGYAGIGLIAAVVVSTAGSARSHTAEAVEEAAAATENVAGEGAAAPKFGINEVDRELLVTALTTAVPIALPAVVRGLLRNLPLVLIVAVVGYILTRTLGAETPVAEPEPSAAE